MIPDGRVVDLTLAYEERMDGVSFEDTRILERDGWNARTLHLYGHSGTHVDAPYHFGVSDRTIDEYHPSEFIGRAHLLRLRVETDSYLISAQDLEPVIDRVEPGESLLVQTGWSAHLCTEWYRDGLPRISAEAASRIVERKVRMLGVETPSVADVNDLEEVTRIHRILMEGGVTIVEGLTNLDEIENDTCTLVALPLKVQDGDGAPARVIAIEDVEATE